MTDQSKRPRQANTIVVGMDELCDKLGIPKDHRPLKLTLMPDSYLPAIGIMVEGPSCHIVTDRGPPYILSLGDFLCDLDARREIAENQYGPYWPVRAFE